MVCSARTGSSDRKTAINQQALQSYYYGVEEIELTTVGQHIILNITFQEESIDWIEGEGQLASLAPLRDDILRGDLRALPDLARLGSALGERRRWNACRGWPPSGWLG